MRHHPKTRLISCLSLLIILFACNPSADSPFSEESPDQKTYIVKTNTAPTPRPEIDYAALSEMELADEISDSIAAAVDDIQTATEMQDENAKIKALATVSQGPIARTDEMIRAYIAFYADISPESVESLWRIQDDLDRIISILDEITAATNQDPGSVSKFYEQLEGALKSTDLKEKAQTWPVQVQSQIEEREKSYAQIQPQVSEVAHHRVGAFTQAYEFLDAYQTALEDGRFSSNELLEISQIAANARASLYSTGDPQLFDIPVKIDALTSLAIQGQWPKVQEGIFELQRSLPARPRP